MTIQTKAQVLLGYDEREYHSRPELSKTQLDQFLVSPLNYWYNNLRDSASPWEPTSSMRIGSMVHKIVLEGEQSFQDCYSAPPSDGLKRPTATQLKAKKPSAATVAQISAWDEYEKSIEGKISPDASELATARLCCDSIAHHPEAVRLLSAIESTEVTIIYDAYGQPMRSRIDGVTPKGIVDVKTTRDASPRGFKSSVYKYNYGLQQFVYSWAYYQAYGRMPEYFIFLCVETSAPYHTALYTLPNGNDIYWRKIFEAAVRRFGDCKRTGVWPGLNNDKLSELPIEYK